MNMREDLKAFVDNELSEERRTEILRALENNPELQAEVIELRQMSRVVKEEAWQPAPVGLQKTLAALEAARRTTPWWIDPRVGMTLAVASATALCAVIFFPVFAQAKNAAKATAAASRARQDVFKQEFATADGNTEKQISGPQTPAFGLKIPEDGKGKDAAELPATQNPSINGSFMKTPKVDVAGRASTNPAVVPPSIGTSMNLYLNQNGLERKANLGIVVDSLPVARQRAEAIAKSVGGRVEAGAQHFDAKTEMTLHVPMKDFDTSVARLRGIGKVSADSVSDNGLSAQYADTDSRLKQLRAQEQDLKKRQKSDKAPLPAKDIAKLRRQIESLDATRNVILQAQPAESTITLSLTEEPVTRRPEPGPNLAARLRTLVSILPLLLPLILPILLIVWTIARRRYVR